MENEKSIKKTMDIMVCPKCGNVDSRYFGIKNGKPYCRKCVVFKGEMASTHSVKKGTISFNLKYSLSKEQNEISQKVIENYKNRKNTLINAVCGAGKTELVYGVIAYALSIGENVAFAVPRKDVAEELFYRIKSVFNANKVLLVCGGHHKQLEADIVVLTTHQLFRYPNYFGLVVLDEIDAFPYSGNEVLGEFFKLSINRNFVMMSATPSNEVLQEFSKQNNEILYLNKRYHHYDLPVPVFVQRFGLGKQIELVKQLQKFITEKKPVFVFVPTIELCEYVYSRVRKKILGGNFVHSKCLSRSERINDFKKGKYNFLITTAVLERGVTVKNLQVIVYEADHYLYDESTLVQISGRVGRKYDAPEGEVVFIGSKRTSAINNAIKQIEQKNSGV